MKDYEFLDWIRDRLINVYNESPNTDFCRRLSSISNSLKPTNYCEGGHAIYGSENIGFSGNCLCGAKIL